MASYTTSLRLIQPATGEYSGTWGTQVNTGLTALVDSAIAGTATITMTAANYTLTNANGVSDESRAMFLSLGGTPGASYQVICPAVSKLYFVTNSTGFAQTVKTAAGSGISVPNGTSMTLRCDGTNVVEAQNYSASLAASGGSALVGFLQAGAGAVSRTAQSKLREVVSAEDFGAVGDGVTNDSSAIQTALNSGKYVALKANKTYLASGLEAVVNGGLVCFSGRAKIKVPAGAGLYGIIIRQSGFTLDGVDFEGGNLGPYNVASPTTGLRVGVSVGNVFGTGAQLQNITVQNCDIYGFDYAGLYGGEVQIGFVFGKRVTLHNVNCYNNYVNIWCSPRFEYIQATLCFGYSGFAGVIAQGGNNKFSGCSFENNYQNCQLATGENDAHGGFTNCSFNHNAAGGKGLFALDIEYGMAFTNCFFWYGDILLQNTKGVQIRNSEIVASTITISGGGVNSIDDNWTRDPITPTFVGTTYTTFRRNRTNTANTSFVPVYGDLYAQATATNYGALPQSLSTLGATVSLKCNYGTKKWQSVDAAFLQSGDQLFIPTTGMYQIDASLTLNIGTQPELVTVEVARKNSGGTIMESFKNSGAFLANATGASISVSNRMLCQVNDTIDILVKTTSAVSSTIPVGGINVKVTSVD